MAGGAFRLGLAGAGRMGRTHLRALAGSDLVRVAAIAEPSPVSREQVAAAGIPVHASVGEMLAGPELDGVLVCTPTDSHGEVIGQIAAAGLAILCEKPCGASADQARAAAGLAAAAGVRLQVAYWRRYVPALRELRERVRGGDLGEIHLVACYQWDQAPPSAAFRARSAGIFADMGVHEFDQIRWLTGEELGELSAVAVPGRDAALPGDPDSAQAIARLSGGATAIVSLGRYHPAGDMARAEVFGTVGTALCPFLDPAEGERAQLAALRAQAEDFAASARDAAAAGASRGAAAADAVAALEAAERAAAAIAGRSGAAP